MQRVNLEAIRATSNMLVFALSPLTSCFVVLGFFFGCPLEATLICWVSNLGFHSSLLKESEPLCCFVLCI